MKKLIFIFPLLFLMSCTKDNPTPPEIPSINGIWLDIGFKFEISNINGDNNLSGKIFIIDTPSLSFDIYGKWEHPNLQLIWDSGKYIFSGNMDNDFYINGNITHFGENSNLYIYPVKLQKQK